MKKMNRFLKTGLFTVPAFLLVSCIHFTKTALDEIQNLRVENISSDSALILWDSVENAEQYGGAVFNFFPSLC